MTREEAIKHLEDMKKGVFLWDMTELIDLCISALSENKGDLISRQAVLDLFHMKYSDKELYKAIYDLPSVENKGEWKEKEVSLDGDIARAESIDPNDVTRMFDGVTEIPKDAFKGWTTEEMLEQTRAESEGK